MLLINKKTAAIQSHKKYARFSPFIRVNSTKYIFFPMSTAELANLRIGQYVHFVEVDKLTLFFVNNNPDGFKLISNGPRDGSLRACSAAFVDWFRKKYNIKGGASASYYVQATDSEFQGHKLFEILTHRERKEIVKNTKQNQ